MAILPYFKLNRESDAHKGDWVGDIVDGLT